MMKQVYFCLQCAITEKSKYLENIWTAWTQLFFILDDAIRKSALPWTHGQSFVSSMKHFDDWDFSERDDDDDVFVSPNQTEPDPTTEKRYNTTGKKYTEKGQTKGMLLRSQRLTNNASVWRANLAQSSALNLLKIANKVT